MSASLHPSKLYAASIDKFSEWSFIDIERSVTLGRYTAQNISDFSSCKWHPDGMMMATTGVDGKLRIWDVRTQVRS
jgi:WD40 repeat protein